MFGRSARTNIKAAQRYKEPKPRQYLLDKTWSLMTLRVPKPRQHRNYWNGHAWLHSQAIYLAYSHIYALI